ncbi:MAG: DUF1616 domain-containing protein [Parcubacteria group bacterium]|jgi:hypothetical protein
MLELFQSQISFYLTIALVLFVPGYFMLLAFFGKEKLGVLERFIAATGLSILITDFLMLVMSRVEILFTRASLVITLLIFSASCFLVYRKRFKKAPGVAETKASSDFSFKQTLLIILILFLSIFIRSVYLQNNLPSSSTDLGHHMYWSKLFAESGKIQNYTQREIVLKDGAYQIDAPKPISDFVIGEHLIFTAISLISGASFISAFPVSVLLFINIFSLLAVFILSLRLFEASPQNKNIAIFALLFCGALFVIDPPQAKFVGGGVIGNILGNLLIPLTFYFYVRFLREKESVFLFFALFFSMGLFYTHHLSGLIFLLTFVGFVALSFLFNFQETKQVFFSQKRSWQSPLLLAFLVFSLVFVFIIYTPTYLTNSAVNTVVGAVKKIEHTGLSILQFRNVLGEARFALGAFGILLFLAPLRKSISRYSFLLLFSWISVITLISLAPGLVKISIPSGRVANYGVYPFAIISAFAFISVFGQKDFHKNLLVPFGQKLIIGAFLLLFIFINLDGFSDTTIYLKGNDSAKKTFQTFNASEYLATRMKKTDLLASDHVYLFADSWVKLFFMRDYYFPSYRANFERYENGVDKKEFCTRDMISNPGGELGEKCYSDLGTNFVMVNKLMDGAQFRKLNNFWQVYSNEEINIYYRNK